ncbi:MAG: polysaccharide deacetylase family protein [bacterium]
MRFFYVTCPFLLLLASRVGAMDFEIVHGNKSFPEVALTFDGDWLDNAADQILDALRAEGIHSTFFLTGRFIRKYPETVKRIVMDGHEVGNHTETHPLWAEVQEGVYTLVTEVTKETVARQLLPVKTRFEKVSGTVMAPFWRPPYGGRTSIINRWAHELGFTSVYWGIDSLDWVPGDHELAEAARERVERIVEMGSQPGTANGLIILMHVGSVGKKREPLPVLHAMLPEIIAIYESNGYVFVSISELIDDDFFGDDRR